MRMVASVANSPVDRRYMHQLTVSFPLQAINDIFAKSVAEQNSHSLGHIQSPDWVSVTTNFF